MRVVQLSKYIYIEKQCFIILPKFQAITNMDGSISEITAANLHSISIEGTKGMPETPKLEIPRQDGRYPRSYTRSRAGSPPGSLRGFRHFAKSKTQYTGASNWSQRSEASSKLYGQARAEFLTFMELLSSLSLHGSSLKEVWEKITLERESFCAEMERMQNQCNEYTEIIESKESDNTRQRQEYEERAREITRLRLELNTANNSSSEFEIRLSKQEAEINHSRSEITELRDKCTRIKTEHEEAKRTLAETQLKLNTTQGSCDRFKGEATKHQSDLRSLDQQYTELKTRYERLTRQVYLVQSGVVAGERLRHVLLQQRAFSSLII